MDKVKELSFFMREWISINQSIIFTTGKINAGTIIDSPKLIEEDILKNINL